MSSYILDLAKSPTGQIWVSTNLGLQKYDYQTDSFTLIDFTKGINCYSLQFDQQGNLRMILNGYSLVKYNEVKVCILIICIKEVILLPPFI